MGRVGGVTSRANPKLSHSFVTPIQLAGVLQSVLLQYSTLSQPSTKFHGLQAVPVGAPFQFGSCARPVVAMAKRVVPTPVTAHASPWFAAQAPPAVRSMSLTLSFGLPSGCN